MNLWPLCGAGLGRLTAAVPPFATGATPSV